MPSPSIRLAYAVVGVVSWRAVSSHWHWYALHVASALRVCVCVNSFCAFSLSRQFRIHCYAALHQSIRIQLVVNRRPRHNTFDCCDVFLFWINKIRKYPVFARFFSVSKKRFESTIDIQSEIIIRFSSCRVLHLYFWCVNNPDCIAGLLSWECWSVCYKLI